jgi:hypothetical protein
MWFREGDGRLYTRWRNVLRLIHIVQSGERDPSLEIDLTQHRKQTMGGRAGSTHRHLFSKFTDK